MGHQVVGVSQTRVCNRHLGIIFNCLLEELGRLLQSMFGALFKMVAALQIEVLRDEAFGARNPVGDVE